MNVQYLECETDEKLAYIYTPPLDASGALPVIMFMGGYRSNMNGTKATYLEEKCTARGQGYLRFDYAGHGQSSGAFEDGTIGQWFKNSLDMLNHVVCAPVILVGSSMGGWLALLVAQARAPLVKGVVGLAAAPDFTEDIYRRLDAAQRQMLEEEGVAYVPNDYSDAPYAFTKNFYEEAKNHLLLGETHNVAHPMRLIQGGRDKDVPWQTAVKIQKAYEGCALDIVVIEDGGHSLSRPDDLDVIDKEIKSLCRIV